MYDKILDTGFEIIATGMEMIAAVVDEYERCHPKAEPRVKTDDPSTFEESLCENQNNTNQTRRR
jgi:hypothetical protein